MYQNIISREKIDDLEAVAIAVIQACAIPLKKTAGFCPVNRQKIAGRVIRACIDRPATTVTMYNPNILAVSARLTIDIILPAMRHIIPKGAYLK